MAGKITHFEIAGKNSRKLGEFYTKLFDWKIKHENMPGGEYGLVETGGGRPTAASPIRWKGKAIMLPCMWVWMIWRRRSRRLNRWAARPSFLRLKFPAWSRLPCSKIPPAT
jgi:hypothetical protein